LDRSFGHFSLIDFESEFQGGARTNPRPDTTLRFTQDRAVQLQLVAPECFRPEGVVAKDFLSLVKELLHVRIGLVTKRLALLGLYRWIRLDAFRQTRTCGD
jgi:hypothetical protein